MKNRRIMWLIIFALPAFGLMSGCTTNPYSGQQQPSKTAVGVGAGAATGAVIGQVIGGHTGATLIGAGVGAVAGGLIGGYMDHQEAELRNQLQGTGVTVVRNGKNIQLVMPSDITFATNSAAINPKFYRPLNSVAVVLKKYNKSGVKVAGYTDNTGTAAYNQKLSEQRANAVANYLMSQGVANTRFYVVGFGERYPVASNDTAAGKAQNRRVVITISN